MRSGVIVNGVAAMLALEGGNLRHLVDFRSLYATVLERWWGMPGTRVLNGRFETLDLLRG